MQRSRPQRNGDGINEPIAVIGIGCRFPGGVDDPQSYWKLLIEGRDGIVDVPEGRWDVSRFYDPDPSVPGKMYVKAGGFLQQRIDEFDALAFGIAPREAMSMDPQQRLLLEVAWEALEDAGLDVTKLAGSDTGVFVGGFMLDNMLTQLSPLNRELIGPQTAVSTTMSILSNRISYVFDLRGPSISLDTACSSSLVATHQGAQSLWRGECSMVLVGGVNVMYRPENPISMCKGQFLAPDGRCKSFDARGDGYGRGEGAGIVVLKPLGQAIADGDRIYGVICGTGSNQDGRTNGITVPNPQAQASLIRRVCAESGIEPRQIRYFEAHGTGTAVGDPLEAGAIGSVVGKDFGRKEPCVLGSVKANIGHLEAASGVAGLIKAVLCLKHQQIPPLANLQQPNPAIDFDALGLRLPRVLEPMPAGEGPAYIGVNSFGYGGTNAHVILSEPPITASDEGVVDPNEARATGPKLLAISARSEAALNAAAQRYAEKLSAPNCPTLEDLCYSAGARRGHHDYRLAVVGDSHADMHKQLEYLAAHGRPSKTQAAGRETEPVFVLTGMGPQWWAMGRELLRTEPAFRAEALACDAIFESIAGWSILAEMTADEKVSRITETQIAQPANFVIQAGIAALLRSWGIQPAALVGHSVGEVASGYLSGMLSLEDALRVSFHRSRIQKKAAGLGGMLAAGLSMEQAEALIAEQGGRVAIAAANGPTSVTLAGETAALETIANQLKDQGLFNRFLQVEVAYHSPYMDALLPELRESLQGLRVRAPTVPLYSTVTGKRVTEVRYDAEYWCGNVRQSVLFARAMDELLADGYRLFIEVGPHPVLAPSIKECIARRGVRAQSAATLRREKPERATLLEGVGALYTAGYAVDWQKMYPSQRYVALPSYPWQRETHWRESAEALSDRLGNTSEHPLLQTRLSAPRPSWESTLNAQRLAYLPDHRVDGLVILPGAAYVEAGLAIHQALNTQAAPAAFALEDLRLRKALVVEAGDEPVLRLEYDEAERTYSVQSRGRNDKTSWTLHASGRLSSARVDQAPRLDLNALRDRGERLDAKVHYERMRSRGLQYGPWFQGVNTLWHSDGEVLAHIAGSEALASERSHLHPCLLDACFQSLIVAVEGDGDESNLYLPTAIRQLRFHASPPPNFYCHGRLTQRTPEYIEGDLTLCDASGEVLVEVFGLRCQRVGAKASAQGSDIDQWLYQYRWQPAPLEPAVKRSGRWLIVMDRSGVGRALAGQLLAANNDVLCVAANRPQGRASKEEIEQWLRDAGAVRGVVDLSGLDPCSDSAEPTDSSGPAQTLHLIQAMAAAQWEGTRLYVITQGVQAVADTDGCAVLEQSLLVGLSRVAMSEHPELRCTLVDLDPHAAARESNLVMLGKELLADSEEDELAFRAEERFGHRLMRIAPAVLARSASQSGIATSADTPFHLQVAANGELEWRGCARRMPSANEVEIQVHAVALTREDARRAAGKAGDGSFYDPAREITGVVTRVGADVREYHEGDVLRACLPSDIGSFVTVATGTLLALPIPRNEIEHAGGLVNLVGAYHGLVEVAHLEAGETLLIRGALDSSGAILLAKARGARVLVAAEGDAEKAALRRYPVDGVFDAGSADFSAQVLAATAGRGVDVLLNARASMGNDLSLLAPYGHYIQLGAIEERAASSFRAADIFERNLRLVHIDVRQMMLERPWVARKMLPALKSLTLGSLPMQRFHTSEMAEALQRAAADLGAVSVVFDDDELPVLPMRSDERLIKADATYLITGGFGGFGLAIAQWLATQGARHLVLVGRSGAATAEARLVLDHLRSQGVRVLAAATDVSQGDLVARLLEEVERTMPPLKGILHTAGVLDDGNLLDLTRARLDKVLAPKALGAWNLHRYSQHIDLDFFTLFSSISALIGNATQGNYVAANLFLDTLAHYRRARGLVATSINWGVLSEVGMAAANKEVEEHLERVGIRGFSTAQAMQALERSLEWQPIQLGVMNVDWAKWRHSSPAAASPRFASLVGTEGESEEGSASSALRRELAERTPEVAEEQFAELFSIEVAATLRLGAARVDLQRSFTQMGGDSLMAIELQTRIRERFGVETSTLELLKEKTLGQLSTQLLEKLLTAAAPAVSEAQAAKATVLATAELVAPSSDARQPIVDGNEHEQAMELLASLDQLSDDEVNRLYESMQIEKEVAP